MKILSIVLFLTIISQPFYGATRTSNGAGGGTWSSGSTWVGGVAPVAGDNAVIANGDIVTLGANASITNCTVNTGGKLDAETFTLTVSAAFTLQSGATFEQGGTVNSVPGATRSLNAASTVTFNGSQTQIAGYFTFGNLVWNSSSSPATVQGDLTINGDLTILSNQLRLTSSTTASRVHTIAGNLTIDGSTSAIVINANGAANPGSCQLTINGNLVTQNGGNFRPNVSGTAADAVLYLKGNLVNNGSFTVFASAGGVLISFNGTTSQTVSGTGITWIRNIEINNSSGVTFNTNFTIGTSPTVSGTLTFTSGKITLGTGNFTIGSNGSISGNNSSRYFVTAGTGYLIRNVPATNTNVGFPLGTSSSYSPAILNNNGGTADNYSVRVAESTQSTYNPNGTSGIQWTINEASNGGSQVILSLQWNGTNEGANFSASRSSGQIARYTGSGVNWAMLATTISGSDPYNAVNTSAINGTGVFSNSIYTVGLESALPVELASFSASYKANAVYLNWQTATEVNNYGFEVERSEVRGQKSDDRGQNKNLEWGTVGFVRGHGNSNSIKNYSFADENIPEGNYQYRLKQIDNDGKFEYSDVVELSFMKPGDFVLDQNYPNPFNPTTNFRFQISDFGLVTLKLYDLLGKEVAVLVNEEKEQGSYKIEFDGSSLSSGIYYYTLTSGEFTSTKKFLLLK